MSLKTDEAALSELVEVQRSIGNTDLSPELQVEIDGKADRVRHEFTRRAQAHFQEYIELAEAADHFLATNDSEPLREARAAIEAQD